MAAIEIKGQNTKVNLVTNRPNSDHVLDIGQKSKDLISKFIVKIKMLFIKKKKKNYSSERTQSLFY